MSGLIKGLAVTSFIAGVALAAWCVTVLVESRFVRDLPVPTGPSSLPGEGLSPSRISGPGAWVGRLLAPTVDMSVTILEGTDDSTLEYSAGHIENTALPGQSGNVGVAGHRDTLFRPVRNLHAGDPIDLATSTRTYHYRVTKTMVVDPTDVYVLDAGDHATLTLVTCYPFNFIGNAPKRFIVQADLVSDAEASAADARN
jgi:sortase A